MRRRPINPSTQQPSSPGNYIEDYRILNHASQNFGLSNFHSTLDFCPRQAGRKQMYHYVKEAKSLMF